VGVWESGEGKSTTEGDGGGVVSCGSCEGRSTMEGDEGGDLSTSGYAMEMEEQSYP